MTVLVVVHGIPPDGKGGAERYAYNHALELQRQGERVVILTRQADPSLPEYAVTDQIHDGIRVLAINNTFSRITNLEDSYRNENVARIAATVIDEVRPDVSHVHHLTGLSTLIPRALAGRGIPVFLTLHDYWLMCHRGQLLNTRLERCDGPGERGCGACLGASAGVGSSATAAGLSVLRAIEERSAVAAAALRRGAAVVSTMVAREADVLDQEQRRLSHMRQMCAHVTHFFAPSVDLRDRFIAFGIRASRISLAELGIDAGSFAPAVRGPRRQRDPLRVAFVGTLMISKAPDLVLRAVASLPRGAVTVDLFGAYAAYHGDNRYRSILDPLIVSTGACRRGHISQAELRRALADVDVLVVPSVWPENSPLVIREAFAAGVPVVASRIGGIPEMVRDDVNGLLFESGNVHALADALRRLIEEPETLTRLRAGIPDVRTIADDAAAMRAVYAAAPPKGAARLAAIILNYRTPDQTFLAVKAVLASDRRVNDVFVVNNGAADPTIAARLARFGDRIAVIHTGENLGFSGGMNAGIDAALARGAERILLVNSDVIVPPDCVGRLDDALARSPHAGIAGPAMLARTDPGHIASLGIVYSQRSGRMRHRGFGDATGDADLSGIREVDAVSGCVMLIDREVLERAGRLDDRYFYSFEDIDFCLRARQHGFATILALDARVYHEGNRSIGHDTPARLYFAARNHLLLARQTRAASTPIAARTVSIVALNVAHAMRAPGGRVAARLAAVFRGTRDYALGRFGAGAETSRLS